MNRLSQLFRKLAGDAAGTVLIETAVVAPVLVVMAVGTFETSAMVTRQSELQSSAEQAVEIALATLPDTDAEKDKVKAVLEESSGLPDARVELAFRYRCGASTMLSTTVPACSEDSLNTYLHITMTDEYQPVWTHWGFGRPFEYRVVRTVQVS